MAEARVRRRDDVLMRAIREATLAELREHGYAGVSFEGVARRAQTSKPVLYRRYRNRAQMVLDAVGQTAVARIVAPHTGSLREDLIGVLVQLSKLFSRFPPDVYRGVLGEADEAMLDDALNAFGAVSIHTMRTVLDEARSRGDLGSVPLPERVALLPITLLRHELLLGHSSSSNVIEDIVDQVCLPLVRASSRHVEPTE